MLKEVKIEMTNKCYRNCKHCSSDATCDEIDYLFLDVDTIKRIINEASEMGATNIAFTGGEATLHPNLKEAINYAKKLGLKTKLYSMCYRTNENIKLLIDLNLNGLDEVIYSTATDLIVSEELSCYTIEEFIKILITCSNLLIGFHHVVTNETIKGIEKLYLYAEATGKKLDKISFLRYVPHGRGDNKLLPSKEEISRFKDYLIDLQKIYGNNIRIGSPFNILNLTNTPCNAADETMIVGFDGHVYPCDAMKYFDYLGSGGNIFNKSLNDIYNSKYFKDIRNSKNNHNEDCKECKDYKICQSGCLGQKMIYATSLEGNKTLEWYEVNAKRTMNNFSSPNVMKMNAKMGIAGETGMLIDYIKKIETHNCNEELIESIKQLMREKIGDIIWYIPSSLSSFYGIAFDEIGSHLLQSKNKKVKMINENIVAYCSMMRDPDCKYLNRNKGIMINQIDSLINDNYDHVHLVEIWESLDKVSFNLRNSEKREDVISFASDLIIILGRISHYFLNTTLENILNENIFKLQQKYPMGFVGEQAGGMRIALEERLKSSLDKENVYTKK